MIKDFIRHGVAWFKCTCCGAETTILKYELDQTLGYEVINHQQTKDSIEVFMTTHALCKPPVVQTDLFKENPGLCQTNEK